MGRGGKASSKANKDYFNLQPVNFEPALGVHLDSTDWRQSHNNADTQDLETNVEECNLALIPNKEHSRDDCIEAKHKELESWKKFEAYREVEDSGQDRLSHRWVLLEKEIDGKRFVKARLVCGGFEETISIQSDSPTGSKETLHILLAIAAANSWDISSLDVKNAFLQGEKLNRRVYMGPPSEMKKPGKVWLILKSVYGMNDAGRRWYFRVKSCLETLGCSQSKLDPCLFFLHRHGKVSGLLIIWVDDFFYSGDQYFKNEVIKRLETKFQIGRTMHNNFVYTGLEIEKNHDGISVIQIRYSEKIRPAVLQGGIKSRPLDKEEKTIEKTHRAT